MAKRLEEWLDEFVENGADATQITEWPDNAGEAEAHFPAGDGLKEWHFYPRELLKYLIKSGVDVDAEIDAFDLSYMSVDFGLAYRVCDRQVEVYGSNDGALSIYLSSDHVQVRLLDPFVDDVNYVQTPDTYSYRTILEALPEKIILTDERTREDIVFISQLYIDTNSSDTQRYDLSSDDFFSFFKYEAEVVEEAPTVIPGLPVPKIPVGN